MEVSVRSYSGIFISVMHFILKMVRKVFFKPSWVLLGTHIRVSWIRSLGLVKSGIKHQYQDCRSHVGADLWFGLIYKAKHTFVQ